MFRRKLKYEVVPESAYTDFSDRYEEKQGPSNSILISAATAATASLATVAITRYTNPTINHTPPIPLPTEAVIEPVNVLTSTPDLSPVFIEGVVGTPDNMIPIAGTPEMIPTGLIAESSLNMLANVLDPVVQILTAISFPIASVIMVGACFFFMIGNAEKGWSTIMNAGLGYVLIQMSPLFLEILRQIGKAI